MDRSRFCEKCEDQHRSGPCEETNGDVVCSKCGKILAMACDGRTLNREDYPELYEVIRETFRSADPCE